MDFIVTRMGERVGQVHTAADGFDTAFAVQCRDTGAGVPLRCVGTDETGERTLLLGVLEPKDGALCLRRVLTRQTLRQAGFDGVLPTRYSLSLPGEDIPKNRPPQAETPKETEQTAEPRAQPQAPKEPEKDALFTGDPLLDAVVRSGEVRAVRTEAGIELTCPFSPTQPFPLIFAAAGCRVTDGVAHFLIKSTKNL